MTIFPITAHERLFRGTTDDYSIAFLTNSRMEALFLRVNIKTVNYQLTIQDIA